IVGTLTIGGEKIKVSGQIDRLAVTADTILIGDFKTTRPAPVRIEDAPQSYVRQLALYRALLQKLYPKHTGPPALIWTEATDLMEISDDAMDAALREVTSA